MDEHAMGILSVNDCVCVVMSYMVAGQIKGMNPPYPPESTSLHFMKSSENIPKRKENNRKERGKQ